MEAFIAEFGGSSRFVLDDLVKEVLNGQSDNVRSFLLDTCVFDELTRPLCDALTGRDDGAPTLEALQRANVFVVALDGDLGRVRQLHGHGRLVRGK